MSPDATRSAEWYCSLLNMRWQKELSSRGITFTPIAETPIGWVIVFRDPDNIQLEFWLPAA